VPIYQYIDDDSGEVFDVIQNAFEKHEFFVEGKQMRRLFSVPNVSIDSKPMSESAFLDKTSKMKGTVGDLHDFSRDLSEKRGGDNDPVRQSYYSEYAAKRRGKEHPDVIKVKKAERLKKLESKIGVKVTT
jgi:hypothetical protein